MMLRRPVGHRATSIAGHTSPGEKIHFLEKSPEEAARDFSLTAMNR